MNSVLNQPFKPYPSKKIRLYSNLSIGLFIFLFLFIFKPSPQGNIPNHYPFLVCLGFGLLTSLVLFVISFFIAPFVVTNNWTLGKSILLSIFSAASVGVANYFAYVLFILEVEFKTQYLSIYLKYFFLSIMWAIIIGIIPVTIQYFIVLNKQYRKTLKDAGILDKLSDTWQEDVIIKAGNIKNEHVFSIKDIHYIFSDENYITVFHFKDESLQKTIIRGTLLSVESELKKQNQFIRCHKRYIVNIKHINSAIGNTQNLKLTLKTSNIEIPVSRSKATLILKKIGKI